MSKARTGAFGLRGLALLLVLGVQVAAFGSTVRAQATASVTLNQVTSADVRVGTSAAAWFRLDPDLDSKITSLDVVLACNVNPIGGRCPSGSQQDGTVSIDSISAIGSCNIGEFPPTSNGDGGVHIIPTGNPQAGLTGTCNIIVAFTVVAVPHDVDSAMRGAQTFVQLDVLWSENRALGDEDGPLFHTQSPPTMLTIVTNRAPTAESDSYVTNENTPLVVNAAAGLLANDTDPENDPLTAVPGGAPTRGTLTLNPDGSFTYTPFTGTTGPDSFLYRARDGIDSSALTIVHLNVVASNAPPVASGDAYSVAEDTPLTISAAGGVLVDDSDADGDSLTAVLESGPGHGALTLNPDGSFTYTPAANFNGADSFTYRANDGTGDSNVATVDIAVNAVNDAPIATNDSYTTRENEALSPTAITGLLANDIDVDGDSLTAAKVSDPSHGSVVLGSDGSFTYTPTGNFHGTDSFTYRANDSTTNSNVATVTITVTPVNDAPVASNDSYTTAEDTMLTRTAAGGVLANDTDADLDTLDATLVGDAAHGSVSLASDGSFTYTPDAGFTGPDSFTYRARDGVANSNIATVSIAVTAVDDAPLAANDSYSTDEDTALSVAPAGVLGNDTDSDSGPLTVALVAGPGHAASFTLNANGSFSYTPDADFHGTDSFTYRASDGTSNSNTATVTISVASVDDPPIAVNDSYSTDEDVVLHVAAPGALGNDSDVDSPTLAPTIEAFPAHAASFAMFPDGSISYLPEANFNGTDSFSYRARDATGSGNVATVTITVNAVNDAPTASDDAFSTSEDTALTIDAAGGVLADDTDIDGGTLAAALVSGPGHGSLTLNPDGSFSYTPTGNFHGSDAFTYRANDGSVSSNVATVSLTVNPVNDAPTASNDAFSTSEDTALTIEAAGGVLTGDADVEGDALTAVLVSGPGHGSLTLNPDGSFSYTPTANFHGSDAFTYRANDGTAGGNVATVSLTVNAVNDAPVAQADAYTGRDNETLTVGAPAVLANDSDVDGDTLTVVKVADPTDGTVVLNADGSFAYTPNHNFHGTDSFTYRINDGTVDGNTVTVTLTIDDRNDAPVSANDATNTAEDTAITVPAPGVLADDRDDDPGDTLSAVKVTDPAHGTVTLDLDGSYTYTPAANFHGTDSFTYRATDGTANSNTATVTITVTPVNDAPAATADTYAVDEDTTLDVSAAVDGVLANDTDVDGDALTAAVVDGPAHGALALAADGTFTYTPDADFHGTDSFTYAANDADESTAIAVTITVGPVADGPLATDDSFTMSEDATLDVSTPIDGVLVNDSDADGDTLTATLVDGPEGDDAFTLHPDGTFSYTPPSDFNGTTTFTYQANDGASDSNTATVTITVDPVNDAPVATPDAASTDEDSTLTVDAPGVLANDTDLDGDVLTAVIATEPAHGTVVLRPDGGYTYTPAADYHGADTFTYTPHDGVDAGAAVAVTLTVRPINDAPTGTGIGYVLTAGAAFTVAAPGLLANAVDVDSTTLVAILVSGPSHGTLDLRADGGFTYTPDPAFTGEDSFTYRIDDSAVTPDAGARAFAIGPVLTVTLTVEAGPTTTTPPPSGGPPTGPATPTAPGNVGELPATGSNSSQVLVLAFGLVACGALVAATARRRLRTRS